MKTWAVLVVAALVLLRWGIAEGATDRANGGRARATARVSEELAQIYEGRGSRSSGDLVLIDAVASHDAAALKADLEALGMKEAVAFGRIVSGRLPVTAIGALDGLSTLQFARPAHVRTHPD